jgi:hypothetical protein
LSFWSVLAIWQSKWEGEEDDEDMGSVKKRKEVLVEVKVMTVVWESEKGKREKKKKKKKEVVIKNQTPNLDVIEEYCALKRERLCTCFPRVLVTIGKNMKLILLVSEFSVLSFFLKKKK